MLKSTNNIVMLWIILPGNILKNLFDVIAAKGKRSRLENLFGQLGQDWMDDLNGCLAFTVVGQLMWIK